MSYISFRNIKNLQTRLDLDYRGYKMSIERNNDIITIRTTIRTWSDIGKVEVMKIVKDKNYNECLVDFFNVMLRPYLDIAIDDLKKIENKL